MLGHVTAENIGIFLIQHIFYM